MGKLEMGTDLLLRAKRAQMLGRVGPELQVGLFSALKTVDVGADVKDVVEKGITSLGAVQTVNSGAVRYYGVRAVTGTAISPTTTAANADIIVQLLDASNGNAVIAAVKCVANQDAESYNVVGNGKVGVDVTNLRVKAVLASDGSTDATTPNLANVIVYYGV